MDSPDDAIEAVVGGELRLLDPDVRRSADQLCALLHPDFVEHGASGRRWDRDSIVAALTSADRTSPIRVEDMLPVVVAPGIVHLRYVSANGSRRAQRSSIWVHDECGWRAWFHQGTLIQAAGDDPYPGGDDEEVCGDQALASFEQASDDDAAGRETEAIPQYERALSLGLDASRRAQAQVQLAGSLRNVGRVEEAIEILREMEPHASVGDAPRAFLALAL
ncbi:MAG: tetratricopeptide repeat protein, partial [Nocardioidaceae bacterium]